jgi:hypothetical protein
MILTSSALLLGKMVVNGCGDVLGKVVRVVGEPDGEVEELVVEQPDGAKQWHVEAYNVKWVADQVYLKGPRDGFHIAPLPPVRV